MGVRRWALAVADVNWFTTENLFRDVRGEAESLLALRCMDYVNGWRKGIYPWSRGGRMRPWGEHPNAFLRDLVLPSGWMKRYPRLGMRPIARAVRRFWRDAPPGSLRGLVLTYPHYEYLRRQLRPDRCLYYNIDDYTLYWPSHARALRRLEHAIVLHSDATICVSLRRAEELRTAVPAAAPRIHHVPHGTPTAFVAAQPCHRPAETPADLAHLPRPILGYVGSVEGRVDWKLMRDLAAAFPGASVVVVGTAPGSSPAGRRPPWSRDWDDLSAMPNVHAIGWRPQEELPRYYASFDVVLIPYLADHPFNLACSPTKIMDAMGSGRPIVSTAVPECRLYTHLFDVAETSAAFVAAVGSIVARGSDDRRAADRHAHALAHSCRRVGRRVLDLLEGEPSAH